MHEICHHMTKLMTGFLSKNKFVIRSKLKLFIFSFPCVFVLVIGLEVVFQCRDEGPIRARVRWTLPNGRPLPAGSTDVNGRLEIPNIRVSSKSMLDFGQVIDCLNFYNAHFSWITAEILFAKPSDTHHLHQVPGLWSI